MFINKIAIYETVAKARVETGGVAIDIIVTEGIRELGSERADMLRRNSVGAQSESTQPPDCAEFWELLSNFLTPQQQESWPWQCGPWP